MTKSNRAKGIQSMLPTKINRKSAAKTSSHTAMGSTEPSSPGAASLTGLDSAVNTLTRSVASMACAPVAKSLLIWTYDALADGVVCVRPPLVVVVVVVVAAAPLVPLVLAMWKKRCVWAGRGGEKGGH